MIGRLRGPVVERDGGSVTVEAGGVGYLVHVPAVLARDVVPDDEIVLYTHLNVREDALTLFGFTSAQERSLFLLLLAISGIGPKIALAILSTYSPGEVLAAVQQEQAVAFSKVPGIGKKNAERIVLELKGKVWDAGDLRLTLPAMGGSSPLHAALATLGYGAPEIATVIADIPAELPLDEQIRRGLALLNRRGG